MKKSTLLGLSGLVLALAAAGAYQWRSKAQAKPDSVSSGASASTATLPQDAASAAGGLNTLVELTSSDSAPARMRELTQGLAISGSLRAANSALVKARVAGELQGLSLREGDAVKAGQVVARVEPSDYQARLRQAKEQADAARAQIEIAQRQWDNNKALVDQGFISRTALETSQSNLTSAQANHKATLAAVDVAAKAMDDTLLRAPISGTVAQRLAQPGERVAVDGRVLEIVDLSRMELEATVAASDSVRLQVGQIAALRIEGMGQPLSAKLVRINPTAQSGSRQVLAYFAIDKTQGLRQGLFAQGSLGVAKSAVLSVPLGAVRSDKPQPYVQVVENGKIAHRTVRLGLRGEASGTDTGETMVEVEGVQEGTPVLGGHVGALREGVQVKFTTAPSK